MSSERASLQTKYNLHQRNTLLARQSKEEDKERGKTDSEINVACFDLHQVVKGDVSNLYNRRKLNVYNLSIYQSEVHAK